MPLKEQIAARKALEPEKFVCVETSDRERERPVGIAFWPWDALPVVLPWIRFEGAFFVGETNAPELLLAFAGHRIVVQGSDLPELVVPLREQRIRGLRALPPGYAIDEQRERTWITGLVVEETGTPFDGPLVPPPDKTTGDHRLATNITRGIAIREQIAQSFKIGV